MSQEESPKVALEVSKLKKNFYCTLIEVIEFIDCKCWLIERDERNFYDLSAQAEFRQNLSAEPGMTSNRSGLLVCRHPPARAMSTESRTPINSS